MESEGLCGVGEDAVATGRSLDFNISAMKSRWKILRREVV